VRDKDLIDHLAGDTEAPLEPQDRAAVNELRALLADESVWIEPDPALEQRVVTAITDAAAVFTLDPAPARAPVPERSAARRSRRPSFGLRRLAASLAPVLAAAVVLVVVLSSGSAPLQFAVTLHGTGRAPGAGGSATLTKTTDGWRIALRAHGLPLRQNGLYYQAWLKNASGILVPVGTFNLANQVTLWAGVAPTKGFTTLTITRQQASHNTASTHQVVLKGIAHRIH
jgi:hypothetical protein